MKHPMFRRQTLAFLLLVLTAFLALAAPAAAHTGFSMSSPADGAFVDEPLSEISITFTGIATPAGDGFVVLGPDGFIRTPDDVVTTDNLTWTLHFDEPLEGGVIGVRWRVAAPDAHPIEGSFSFTVADAVLIAEPESPPEPETTTTTSVEQPTTTEAAIEQPAAVEPPIELDEFLDTTTVSAFGADRVGDVGRALAILGFALAFGGIVFATFVLRGDQADLGAVLSSIRRAGVLVLVGTVISAVAQVATLASGWAGLWSPSALADALVSSFGIAVVLRLIGGALIATGAKLTANQTQTASGPVGAALLVSSFLFDGHTVSEGPRWLHAAANSVHVMTAATWAGGVVMLAFVITRRHRRNADSHSLQLAARFSVVAVFALVGAGVAGVALTIVIIDSVSEIWTTPWGQLLIVKTILVGLAATAGGYNHWILIPLFEQSPNDEGIANRFRTIVTFEAIVLVIVAVVTGLLIAASSS